MKVAEANEWSNGGAWSEMPSEQRINRPRTFDLLDDLDRRIVAELYDDARLRIAELGRRVGLSPPAVTERLRRLIDSGAVRFQAEVAPRALGYTICAIVRVSPTTRDLKLIPDVARQLPQVTECYRITGDDCYFFKLYLRSIDELEPILDRFTPLGRTTTSIVNATPVPPRPLPVTETEPAARISGDPELSDASRRRGSRGAV
jgi:Lrp/AsnC family transcriptional regulator, leucine-responsive regulatory protein